jgi:hypothetical protein
MLGVDTVLLFCVIRAHETLPFARDTRAPQEMALCLKRGELKYPELLAYCMTSHALAVEATSDLPRKSGEVSCHPAGNKNQDRLQHADR